MGQAHPAQHGDFNPRSPCGERRIRMTRPLDGVHFNPRSPCGERLCADFTRKSHKRFQSTLPMRGATRSRGYGTRSALFQSTLPMRGATQSGGGLRMKHRFQSTLPMRGTTISARRSISAALKFQSTLPMRGATSSLV